MERTQALHQVEDCSGISNDQKADARRALLSGANPDRVLGAIRDVRNGHGSRELDNMAAIARLTAGES